MQVSRHAVAGNGNMRIRPRRSAFAWSRSMTETLLSPSSVFLFGRKMEDLEIKLPQKSPRIDIIVGVAAEMSAQDLRSVPPSIDGVPTESVDKFLFVDSADRTKAAIYKIRGGKFSKLNLLEKYQKQPNESVYYGRVMKGVSHGKKAFTIDENDAFAELAGKPDPRHGPFAADRAGVIGEVEQQLVSDDSFFARIYGFSYEGYLYDLPRPVLFLVHGDGLLASEARTGFGGVMNRSRAPGDPSLTGLAVADFQFADEVRVWSYDKADYTIRMDVDTGMFEDILLNAVLGGAGGLEASGMNARGMNARGMNARGMNARGMNARGMNARGGSGD